MTQNIWYISITVSLITSVLSVIFTQSIRDFSEEKKIYREKLEKGYEIIEQLQDELQRIELTMNDIIQKSQDMSTSIPVSPQEFRLKLDSRLASIIKLELFFLTQEFEQLKDNISQYNILAYFHLRANKSTIEELSNVKNLIVPSQNKIINILQNMSKKIEKEMDKPSNKINIFARIRYIICLKGLKK